MAQNDTSRQTKSKQKEKYIHVKITEYRDINVVTLSTGWPKKSKPLPIDQKIVLNRIKTCE